MEHIINVLIEGVPGIGKTTLIRHIASKINHLGIGGFYTEEIREKNTRIGFHIDTFSGRSGILAHINFKHGPNVGKYKVDLNAFETIAVQELERALRESQIILIDEIGKMELYSNRFKNMVLACLNCNKLLVASIMMRSHPFADSIKRRPDVNRIKLTLENRNELAAQIITQIV